MIYELGYRQWDIPKLRDLLEHILPDKTVLENYEVTHEFENIGRRSMLLTARKLEDAKGRPASILLSIQDSTEMLQVQAAERLSAARLEHELASTQQLQLVSAALIQGGDAGALYQAIVDAAIVIMHSDMASMHVLDEDEDALRMLAWRGFDAEFGKTFQFVRRETRTSCGVAWRTGRRVIVSDVEKTDFIMGTPELEAHLAMDIRASQSTPLFSRDGRLLGMITTHWRTPHTPTDSDLRPFDILARQAADLIERKQTEAATALLGAIVGSSDDAIISKGLNGVITSWNKSAERLFGYTAQEAIGQSVTMLIPPDRLSEEPEILAQLVRGERVEHFETVRVRKDGSLMDISLTISPVKDSTGRVIGASKIARDITEHKRMEAELATWQRELELRVVQLRVQLQAEADERKRLEAEIAMAVEAEQQRLGQELHDGLAQEMTGVGYLLEALALKLTSKHARELLKLRGKLGTAIEKTRNLAKGFYPVEIEKYGLEMALRELAKHNQERFGVSCLVEADEKAPVELRDSRAIQLFRIAQEAVHNAAKHAKAKHVLIRLEAQNGGWLLTVRDDGVGLRRDVERADGMGLRIMQYRAQMIGGMLSIRNGVGGGVIVSCIVPPTVPKVAKES